VAEKIVKETQTEPNRAQKGARTVEKDRENPKKPNIIGQWWRETVGELRKVSWPPIPDARRLTVIVLAVMALMSTILGVLDWVFSKVIALLVTL